MSKDLPNEDEDVDSIPFSQGILSPSFHLLERSCRDGRSCVSANTDGPRFISDSEAFKQEERDKIARKRAAMQR